MSKSDGVHDILGDISRGNLKSLEALLEKAELKEKEAMRKVLERSAHATEISASNTEQSAWEDSLHGDGMVTEKEHFAIMRGDGLSHHPMRKHISKDIYKQPMGLAGAAADFPKPRNWLETYRKTIPNINDFLRYVSCGSRDSNGALPFGRRLCTRICSRTKIMQMHPRCTHVESSTSIIMHPPFIHMN